jgi:hypothetical protein
MRLQRIWTEMTALSKGSRGMDQNLLRDLSAARNSMMFFIDCLWSYVQVGFLNCSLNKMIVELTRSGSIIVTRYRWTSLPSATII